MPANTSISSGLLAVGTSQVCTRKTRLNGFVVSSDGTNLATVTMYDNNLGDTSGLVLAQVLANSSQPASIQSFDCPIKCDNGITVVVSGTGASAVIYYDA